MQTVVANVNLEHAPRAAGTRRAFEHAVARAAPDDQRGGPGATSGRDLAGVDLRLDDDRRDEIRAEPCCEPQIEYFEKGDQWTPRGDVLRCVISDGGPDNEPIIYVDDRELSWREFGRLMTTYGGWGMRIVFVPDDELHEEPQIEVREPEEKRRR